MPRVPTLVTVRVAGVAHQPAAPFRDAVVTLDGLLSASSS